MARHGAAGRPMPARLGKAREKRGTAVAGFHRVGSLRDRATERLKQGHGAKVRLHGPNPEPQANWGGFIRSNEGPSGHFSAE